MHEYKVDKKRFKDKGGRYITQSLFLEYQYDTDFAVYTVDDEDKEYKGKIYPSLKKLYLQEEDIKEYIFATTHLYSWEHWNRLVNNKWCYKHIKEWREELEYKLMSIGVQRILDAAQDGNFQAAKYAANKGWDAKRGRPSKADEEHIRRVQEGILDEYEEDAERMGEVVSIK